MPVYQETSSAARDLRILPSRAPPLPRLTKAPVTDQEAKHEVVVIGAGPSGLFLTVLLARYGLTGSSLLCLDAKAGTLKAGQADGLQPRTLEVLKSLGISHEIINEGCKMSEVAFWNPKTSKQSSANGKNGEDRGIERTDFVPDVNVPARYPFEITIHQGRIERIFQDDLAAYASNTIQRSSRFVDFQIDENEDAEYPILVNYERDLEDGTTSKSSLRTKYLVGGDGAHSLVRKGMGLQLEGETTDHIWGVCDFIAETDFPDIRKRCAVHSSVGSVMVIPRERIATGEFLTRLYVQVPGEAEPDVDPASHQAPDKKTTSKKKRSQVTLDFIFEQARAVFHPYKIDIRKGTVPDWWAAYQIGQRMTPQFSMKTSDGLERVFIVGDACHTHSPKAGQGMNVSMMDSYNLAWKLIHNLYGLTPISSSDKSDPILETFNLERVETARQLIEFDTKFSSMFSGQIGSDDPSLKGLTHDEFLRVFSEGSGFTSGCGLRYAPSHIVKRDLESTTNGAIGALVTGKRLLNVEVRRYADANLCQLQDDFPSTGRYRILVLASTNLLDPAGTSQAALQVCYEVLKTFPTGTIEVVVLHPLVKKRFEWTDLPACTKKMAEMRFHGLADKEDAYEVYGVSREQGAIVTVRPDGYVGMLGSLSAVDEVEAYFRGCLVTV